MTHIERFDFCVKEYGELSIFPKPNRTILYNDNIFIKIYNIKSLKSGFNYHKKITRLKEHYAEFCVPIISTGIIDEYFYIITKTIEVCDKKLYWQGNYDERFLDLFRDLWKTENLMIDSQNPLNFGIYNDSIKIIDFDGIVQNKTHKLFKNNLKDTYLNILNNHKSDSNSINNQQKYNKLKNLYEQL